MKHIRAIHGWIRAGFDNPVADAAQPIMFGLLAILAGTLVAVELLAWM